VPCLRLNPRAAQSAGLPLSKNRKLGRGVNIPGLQFHLAFEGTGAIQGEDFRLLKRRLQFRAHLTIQPFRYYNATNGWALRVTRGYEVLNWAIDGARRRAGGHSRSARIHHPRQQSRRETRAIPSRFCGQDFPPVSKRPDDVFFGVLNEPNGDLTPASWNDFSARRWPSSGKKPTPRYHRRPAFWNAIDHCPNETAGARNRNLNRHDAIYTPMEFTHQGASRWRPRDKVRGSEGSRRSGQVIETDFDKAVPGQGAQPARVSPRVRRL